MCESVCVHVCVSRVPGGGDIYKLLIYDDEHR